MVCGLNQSVSDRGVFFYQWFVGLLGVDKLVRRGWGRDLGRPERMFFSVTNVSPSILERGYGLLEKNKRPVYQSVSYYRSRGGAGLSAGVLVGLEKIFVDLDVKGVDPDRARELAYKEARLLYDHLRSYGEPLLVFSGRRGYHIYLWLPEVVEDTELYKYIIRVLGITRLGLRFLDPVVLEPGRIARVPYTIHEVSGKQVTPLDSDFRPIEVSSFNLHKYLSNPMDKAVIEEAVSLREAYTRLEAARRCWMYMKLLRSPWKALRSSSLPDIVEWLLENGAEEGYRNNAAFIIATWLMNKGYSQDETLVTLLDWNNKNKPPLPQKEIEKVVKSVYKHQYKPVSKKKVKQWINK